MIPIKVSVHKCEDGSFMCRAEPFGIEAEGPTKDITLTRLTAKVKRKLKQLADALEAKAGE